MSEQIKRVQVLAIPPEFAPALQPLKREIKVDVNNDLVKAALEALNKSANLQIKLEDVFPEITFEAKSFSPQIHQPDVCRSPSPGQIEDWLEVDRLYDKIFEAVGPDLGGDEIVSDEGEEEITASQSDLKPLEATWPLVNLDLSLEALSEALKQGSSSAPIPALEKLVKEEKPAEVEIPQMVFPLRKRVAPIWVVLYKDDAGDITLHDLIVEDTTINASEDDIAQEVNDYFRVVYAEKHAKYNAAIELTHVVHPKGLFHRMKLKTKRFGKPDPEWDLETSYVMFKNDPTDFKQLNFKDLPF